MRVKSFVSLDTYFEPIEIDLYLSDIDLLIVFWRQIFLFEAKLLTYWQNKFDNSAKYREEDAESAELRKNLGSNKTLKKLSITEIQHFQHLLYSNIGKLTEIISSGIYQEIVIVRGGRFLTDTYAPVS